MARILISTFGSFGDIHPYIAIALELKARGHHPIIATSEIYREKMDALDIELRRVRPDLPSYDRPDEVSRMVEKLMDARSGTEEIFKTMIIPHLPDIYTDLSAAARGVDLILTHPLPLLGPVVAQKLKLPWISSVLSPISFFSANDPPVMPQMRAITPLLKLSPLFGHVLLKLIELRVAKLFAPFFQLRAKVGLPRGQHPLFRGQHSPALVLALFSSVMAEPQLDWPPNTIITGFPFYDRRDFKGESGGLAPELAKFLDAGTPPIVFTLGSSAIWVATDFYRESIAAACALGQRALLLIGDARNRLSEPLPEGVAAFEYAPYSEVLPRARIIVHQGGIGTTGQSLRAGKPMLVVPFSHDQPDNAARVKRLGVARTLPRSSYHATSATRELRALLDDPSYSTKAMEIGRRVQNEDGARTACDYIESFLSR